MGFLSKIGRAIDPTTPRGLANIATGGMYELNRQTGGLGNPVAGAVGGQIDKEDVSLGGSAPGSSGYMVDRSRPGPGAIRQQFASQAAPGYAMNPYQQQLAQQLRSPQTQVTSGAIPGGGMVQQAGRSTMEQLIAALRGRGA